MTLAISEGGLIGAPSITPIKRSKVQNVGDANLNTLETTILRILNFQIAPHLLGK